MRIDGKGQVDRSRRLLRFRFDGQDFTGHPGDTLASALLANGVRLVGRSSFKYHRPRGVLTAGSEEPNALVEILEGNQQTAERPRDGAGAVRRAGGAKPEPLAVAEA